MKFDSIAQRNSFIEDNLGLVVSRVLKLNNGQFNDDLYQVGAMALTMAADRFDLERGNHFSSFATRTIDGEIKKYMRYDSVIRPFRKGKSSWDFVYANTVSLDAKCGEGESRTNIEQIPCGRSMEDEVLDNVAVDEFISVLDDRSSQVIILAIEGASQVRISQLTGISQPTVGRIIKKEKQRYRNYSSVI